MSVIIAFYNIENCVDYCLNSLLNQTYRNYELICVDDGSTDNTGTYIERYARKYNRIKLFKKPNGGLSDARNYGVSKSDGAYITFVDGDDLVSPRYLETLMRPIIMNDCDISIGRHKRISASEYPFSGIRWSAKTDYEITGRTDAVKQMLYGTPMISPWARIAPRGIYEKHPFPAGKIYEDTLAFDEHTLSFQKYALCQTQIYGYVIRTGSITNKSEASPSQIANLGQALEILHASILNKEPGLMDALAFHESIENCRMLARAHIICKGKKEKNLEKEIVQSLREKAPRVLKDQNVKLHNKARVWLAATAPSLYCCVFSILSRVLQR